MSLFSIILVFIPIILIWIGYRRLMYSRSFSVMWKLYEDYPPGTPMYSILESAKLGGRKYKLSLVITLLTYGLLVANYVTDKIPAWSALLGASAVAAYVYHLIDSVNISELFAAGRIEERRVRAQQIETKKGITIFLIIILAVSGNWAYRNIKDLNVTKDQAVFESLRLSDNGWCSNFADIKVYDGGETVVKHGGWPCINVGAVRDIQFSKKNKTLTMCFDVSLNREYGLPGDESFQVGYKTVSICAEDNWNEGLNSTAFESKIFNRVSPDLNSLKVELCNYYSGRMSYELRSTYC